MIGEWRTPIRYPLASLITDLMDAIERTKHYTSVNQSARLYRWLREMESLQWNGRRQTAEQAAYTVTANLEKMKSGERLTTPIDPWEFPLRDAFRSLLEARMFIHVVRYLEKKLRPEHWRILVRGNLRPEDDKQHTPHRDCLLELYVASAAEAAGFEVELEEPDIVLQVARRSVSIAVKRIKSRRQVVANARYGAAQIASSAAGRGLLFLDVSDVINSKMVAMRYLRHLESRIDGSVHGNLMKFVKEMPDLQRVSQEPHVEGIILRNAVPAMFAKAFIPATLETWNPVVEHPSPVAKEVYSQMLDALSSTTEPDSPRFPPGSTPCEFSFAHI